MKLSRYNHFVRLSDGWLGFNHRTTLMARFDGDTYHRFLEPRCSEPGDIPDDLREQLIRGGFIVENGTDESGLIADAASARRAEQARLLALTIIPTLDCDFDCIYCYEQEYRRPERMTAPIIDGMITMVSGMITPVIEGMHVMWFGGEPTLELPVIEHITGRLRSLCRKHDIDYNAVMSTNGYNLTLPVVKRLCAAGITALQVTVDGLQSTHDQRRRRHGRGTFARIMDNLVDAADQIDIGLRLSVDRDTVDDIAGVFDLLRARGLVGKTRPYVARIDAEISNACASFVDGCFDHYEYVDLIGSKFSGEWQDLPLLLPYPSLNYGLCAATNPSAIAFEPSGALQRCLQLTGNMQAAVGHVVRGRDRQAEDRWYGLDPMLRPQCRECCYLPHCFGGCRRQWLSQGRPSCTMFRSDLDSWLLRRYERERRKQCQQGGAG